MNFLIYGVNNPVIVSAIYCAADLRKSDSFHKQRSSVNMFQVRNKLFQVFIATTLINGLICGNENEV